MAGTVQTGLIALYALAAIAAGWALRAADLTGLGQAVVAGLLIFLTLLVGHEVIRARRAERRTLHRILLLKRAHDRLRQELMTSRDETRRLFELIEDRGGEEVLDALEEAARRQSEARDRAGEAARAAQSPGASEDVEAEVRVLHQLVEQLYSDDVPPVLRSRETPPPPPLPGAERDDARKEPNLGRTDRGSGPPGGRERTRPPLRVVADEGPNALSEERVLEIVRDGLRTDRVDLYLQPIVSLPQRKRRFFECFSRIRAEDGTVVTPAQYLDPARRAGLSTAVDNMLLFRCVQLLRRVRRRDATTAFFCNVSPHTLADREFFRDFISYMENHRELASSLVLEMAQSDFDAQRQRLGPDLKRIAGMGYRFSLDAVDRLDLDLGELEALNIHFLKIDAALILDTLEAGGEAASQLRMLKQQLDAHDIDLIVERIETERMLIELLEFNIDFGQGYLFGEPKLSPDHGQEDDIEGRDGAL